MASDPTDEARRRHDSPPPVEFVRPDEEQAPLSPRDQPKIAGVLLVLAGVVGMAGAIYNAVTLPSVAEYADFVNNNTPELVAVLQICGLVSIWSQALAILGGVMAFKRMNWRLTLVCAVFSLFTLGIFYFEASAIGLLGLIVTVLARPYFVT